MNAARRSRIAADRLRLLAGQDAAGVGRPLRVDADGRLEVVNLRAAHAARVYQTVNLSHTVSGAWQVLTFNAEAFDTDGMHDLALNPSRLTCRHAGLYCIGAQVHFQANGSGIRAARLMLNGTTVLVLRQEAGSAAYTATLGLSTLYTLATGDYLELSAYQNSGGALNLLAEGVHAPVFWAVLL